MTNITWLHLSDLHMKSLNDAENDDRKTVITALLDDIKKQIAEKKIKFDFIIFSGDIAYSGKTPEYENAATIFFDPVLKATGLPKEKLFVVPGNHDIDWSKNDPIAIAGMREVLINRRNINNFLAPGNNRRREFSKFDDYRSFIEDYFEGYLFFNDDDFYYNIEFEVQGEKIALLGLNSVWMSGCYKDSNGILQEKGKLLLGDCQIRNALKKTEEADIRILVMHHPIDWLDEDIERFQIERLIEAECDFVLHGHWHNTNLYTKNSNSGSTVFIPAGTIYQDFDYPNGYNIVQININTNQGIIYFRRFHSVGSQGPVWMKDIVTTGEDCDGEFVFEFPGTEKKPTISTRPLDKVNFQIKEKPKEKSILLAEDKSNWQNLYRRILETDYDVDCATTYSEAKSLLEKPYDAVIVNLCLESDNDFLGQEILDIIEKTKKPFPCIVVTGSQQPMKGLFNRYPFVKEIFPKGLNEERNFPSREFLKIVKEAIGD